MECSATAALRADPRFAPLFEATAPPLSRFRAFMSQPRQYRLAEYVTACFDQILPTA